MLLRQNEIGLYPTVLSYLLWGSENRCKGWFENSEQRFIFYRLFLLLHVVGGQRIDEIL